MNKEFIKKLTELVEVNLVNENYGIEDLAREMGMSHSNLHRKLKSSTNQTISQFIREIRLIKAKELLLNEDLTAAEISYRVGFGSPTYFNKCFHEYFGFAPGELRNLEAESESEDQPAEVEPLPKKSNRRKILISLIVSLIILIPLSVFLINKMSKATIKEKSIAVLPFKYLGDETEKQQYQADGMMSVINNHLSKLYDLRVISETSVEQYRNTDKTVKIIGKELEVAYLLEGRLLMVEDQFKLILQLITTKDDRHVWANEYSGVSETIFNKLSEAAEDIAHELNAEITTEEMKLIRKTPTENNTANDFYTKGKYDLKKYAGDWNTKEFLESAQISFRKSLACDSMFALAYAGLAETYWHKYQWGTDISKKYLDSALIMATRALVFDDRCAEAYLFRGLIFKELGKNEQALKECEKALKYNPNDSRAYSTWFFLNPLNKGDWIKSIIYSHEVVKRFRGPEDLPENLFGLGRTYIEFGFPEQAKKYYKQRLELTQDSNAYLFGMEWVEFSSGNFEEAYRYAIRLYERDTVNMDIEIFQYCTFSGHHKVAYELAKKYVDRCNKAEVTPHLLHRVGYAYLKAGKTEEAKYFFNLELQNYLKHREREGFKNEEGLNIAQAIDCVMLGKKESAFQYLNYDSKNHIPLWALTLLQRDPAFDSIRSDPRFQKVLKAYELQYQAKHDRLKKYLEENGIL